MNAIWLYLPPIILLATLVGLAVLLGKKTAAIKNLNPEAKSRVETPVENAAAKEIG